MTEITIIPHLLPKNVSLKLDDTNQEIHCNLYYL